MNFKVWTANFATALGTLTGWFDATVTDTINEVGHGQFSLQNDDPQLGTCTRGRVVQMLVDSDPAFAWIIDHTVRQSIANNEEVDEFTVIEGDGIAQVLNRVVVKPTRGYDQAPWSTSRTFSFASPEYDASSWGTATAIVAKQSDESTYYTGKPSGWPDPVATWIGPSVGDDSEGYVGNWYVIGDHTFSDPTGIVAFLAADNKADVYADGLALTTFGTEVGFDETHRVTLYASAGQMRFAAKISNFVDGGTDPGLGMGTLLSGNPTAFLASVYSIDGAGRLGPLAIQTDTEWSILEYPSTAPGWTVGGVMDLLLTEAQADGLITAVTWDFDATNDSNGNAWDVLETITLNVGDDYLTVLRSFAGAYCDWAFAPDSFALSMWRLGERGTTQSVTYSPGTNLKSLTHDAIDVGTDALSVSWSGGPQFLYSPGTAHRVASFSAGNARTRAEAEALAAQQLVLLGGTRTQFIAEIEPLGTADQPYTGFTVGDTVSVPDEVGSASSERVTQIVARTDLEGVPIWSPSFSDVLLDMNARMALNLKRMANGTLGGYSATASITGPAPMFGSTIDSSELSFSAPDPLAVGTATKDQVPSQSGNAYAVQVNAQTAGSADLTFEAWVDGSDVLAGGGTLPAGTQIATIPVDLSAGTAGQFTAWLEGHKSRLTINVTDAGTDFAGVVWKFLVL